MSKPQKKVADYIREARKRLAGNVSQRELSERLDGYSISAIESGYRLPSDRAVQKMAEILDLPSEFYETLRREREEASGGDRVKTEREIEHIQRGIFEGHALLDSLRMKLEEAISENNLPYSATLEKQIDQVRSELARSQALFHHLTQKQSSEDITTSRQRYVADVSLLGDVPRDGILLPISPDGLPIGEFEEQVALARELLGPGITYAVRSGDDDMHPVFGKGDVLIISPTKTWFPGDPVFLRLSDGRCYVRIILIHSREIRLTTTNPDTPHLVVSRDEISFIHKIVMRMVA